MYLVSIKHADDNVDISYECTKEDLIQRYPWIKLLLPIDCDFDDEFRLDMCQELTRTMITGYIEGDE